MSEIVCWFTNALCILNQVCQRFRYRDKVKQFSRTPKTWFVMNIVKDGENNTHHQQQKSNKCSIKQNKTNRYTEDLQTHSGWVLNHESKKNCTWKSAATWLTFLPWWLRLMDSRLRTYCWIHWKEQPVSNPLLGYSE